MKATYVGDTSLAAKDREIPDVMETLGHRFEAGKATEIPDSLIQKLQGNPHFELSGKESAAK